MQALFHLLAALCGEPVILSQADTVTLKRSATLGTSVSSRYLVVAQGVALDTSSNAASAILSSSALMSQSSTACVQRATTDITVISIIHLQMLMHKYLRTGNVASTRFGTDLVARMQLQLDQMLRMMLRMLTLTKFPAHPGQLDDPHVN